jgi:mono/diheme cytochrome c family protein
LVDSEWVTGDEEQLINIVLNGYQGEIKVNGKSYSGIMPSNAHLDDHAIASIITYVRARFGKIRKSVSDHQVSNIRNATTK